MHLSLPGGNRSLACERKDKGTCDPVSEHGGNEPSRPFFGIDSKRKDCGFPFERRRDQRSGLDPIDSLQAQRRYAAACRIKRHDPSLEFKDRLFPQDLRACSQPID